MKRKRREKREKNQKENDIKKTRINKSSALVAHTRTHISSPMAADSGNEAKRRSFIVLFSDISGYRLNDS